MSALFKPYYLCYLALILAAAVTGWWRHRNNKVIRPLLFLLLLTFINELTNKLLSHYLSNNSYSAHLYNPLQLVLWACFFYRGLCGPARKTVVPFAVLLVLFSVYNTLCLQALNKFPGNFLKFETVVLLYWSGSLFLEYLERPAEQRIFRDPVFICTIAVIWFNLASFVFFVLFDVLLQLKIATRELRAPHYFSNYTYYTLLLGAMCLPAKTNRQ